MHPAQGEIQVQRAGDAGLVQDGVCLLAGFGDERTERVAGHGGQDLVELAVELFGAVPGACVQP
jgi:hypothetical protein